MIFAPDIRLKLGSILTFVLLIVLSPLFLLLALLYMALHVSSSCGAKEQRKLEELEALSSLPGSVPENSVCPY